MKPTLPILILVILFLSGGCNPYKQDSYHQQYVVESYLVAGNPLPQVQLFTTIPAGQKYDFEDIAVRGADVQIQLLNDDGNTEKTYDYEMYSEGFYVPADTGTVRSQREYRLLIRVPGDSATIEASAIVPESFHLTGSPPDTVIYQSADGIPLTITKSAYPGRQNIYIFSTVAVGGLDTLRLTPFYRDIFTQQSDQDDGDKISLSDYRINASPIVNEANFTPNSNGTLTIKWPWIGIAYYGKNKLVINAIDDNIYDFVRSQSVQTGGNTLPPGQIQNAIMHVKGGIGIFGAMATDTAEVYIKR